MPQCQGSDCSTGQAGEKGRSISSSESLYCSQTKDLCSSLFSNNDYEWLECILLSHGCQPFRKLIKWRRIWTVLCSHWYKKLLNNRSNHFLNAAILLALKVFCGRRVLQFSSPAGKKQLFLFMANSEQSFLFAVCVSFMIL